MRIVENCAKEENGLAQRRLEKLFSDLKKKKKVYLLPSKLGVGTLTTRQLTSRHFSTVQFTTKQTRLGTPNSSPLVEQAMGTV